MHGMQGQEARVGTTQDDAVVTAHEITRRYGEATPLSTPFAASRSMSHLDS